MKIVVTGALGHIGSRLIRELPVLLPGAELVLVDDLSTQRYAALFDLPAEARRRFIEADVTAMDLAPLIAGANAVVHLAAITDATASVARPDDVERVNLGATTRVAEACAAAGVPLIFASTTSVYGTQKEVVDEDCTPEELKPQSPYAEIKLREEAVLDRLGREAGLRFAAFRFGTIFGTSPGMRFHTAVNKFCWQAVMGQPITVWRTALDQRRPYLDLGDAVRAVAFMIEQGRFDNRIYNVVTANATVGEIVEILRRSVPDVEVELVDSPIMNQLSYEVLSPRMDEAGFRCEGDLGRGIADTVALLAAANGRNHR